MSRGISLAVRVGTALCAALGAVLPVTATGVGAQTGPSLELISQTTWVRDDGAFEVTVTVDDAPPGATLGVVVDSQIERRRDLAETFDPANINDDVFSPAARPLAEISNGFGQYMLSYPIADMDLDSTSDYGVYPVGIQLATGTGVPQTELSTYLLLLPDASRTVEPLSVGVVMDLGTTTPGIQPDGVTNLSPEDRTALRNRVEILGETAQSPSIPLTIAPDPETLDALGLGADDDSQSILTDLRQALPDRQVLARPYVDLDVDALANASMLDQVPGQRDTGMRTVQRWLPGIEPVPDVWTTQATIDTSAAETLRGLGIPRAIVPSGAVESVRGHPDVRTPTAPVNLVEDGPLAIVSDDALSERLLGQEGIVDGQRFLAELTLIWQQTEEEPRGIAVRIPDNGPLDAATVQHALRGLSAASTSGPPILQPAKATDLLERTPLDGAGDEPAVVELAPAETPSDNLSALQPALAQATVVWGGLAGSLPDKALIDQLYRSLLIAPGFTTPDDKRMAYVQQVDQERNSLAEAINAPEGFTITLTARDGNIPLQVGNTSGETVMVRVHLSSSQLEFPDDPTFALELPPNGDTINVPVRSRTSGAFPLRVTITSPDDRVVFDRQTFTIRSTAISGVGLVLSIGAGLFLVVWWARHWRTSRRARKLVPEHAMGRRHGVR